MKVSDMVNNPQATIIIATCSMTSTLREAVISALNQTLADFELLIVLNGGMKLTEAELGVADKRIHIVRVLERGIGRAWNTGVRWARGEYVTFLDDDDVMYPQKLAWQVDYLRRNAWAAGVVSDYVVMKNGFQYRVNASRVSRKHLSDVLTKGDFWLGAYSFCRTALEVVGGFDDRYGAGVDYDFFIRLAASRVRIGYHPGLVAEYRLSDTGFSRGKLAQLQVLQMLSVNFRRYNRRLSADERIKVEASIAFRWGKLYFFSGEYQRSRQYFSRVIKSGLGSSRWKAACYWVCSWFGRRWFRRLVDGYSRVSGRLHIENTS